MNKKDDLKMYKKYRDGFLPVCNLFKTFLVEAAVPEEKITVLPTPPIPNFFSSRARDKKQGELRVLSTGRLIKKEGFDCAMRAFTDLIKVYPCIFYHTAGEGVKRGDLSRLIEDSGCQKNVRLLGNLPLCDMPDLYSKAALLLVPSRIGHSGNREGIARVAKE